MLIDIFTIIVTTMLPFCPHLVFHYFLTIISKDRHEYLDDFVVKALHAHL